MSTYTAEEQKANRGKLVAALRSGEYEQGQEKLRSNDKFCCLGVGCEVAANEGVIEPFDGEAYGGSVALLPVEVQDWLGFYDWYGTLTEPVHYSEPVAYDYVDLDPTADALTELNDCAGWTFDQIADLIEAGGVKLAEVES